MSEKRLMQSVLIQAMRDYAESGTSNSWTSRSDKEEAKRWVVEMSGTFELVAHAMDMEPETLQKMCLDKMRKIDEGVPLKEFEY